MYANPYITIWEVKEKESKEGKKYYSIKFSESNKNKAGEYVTTWSGFANCFKEEVVDKVVAGWKVKKDKGSSFGKATLSLSHYYDGEVERTSVILNDFEPYVKEQEKVDLGG